MKRRGSLFIVLFTLFHVNIHASVSTFYVTTTDDSGAGTLRQAILDANASAGADTILFDIPSSDGNYDPVSGVWTISLLSGLPKLTDDSTFVDGSSQAVNQGNTNPEGPEIELNGNQTLANGFWIQSAENTIRGIVVNRFKNIGISIDGEEATGNVITGNYLGTDVKGESDLGNAEGIRVLHDASKNTIGGRTTADRNLISGNDQAGISFIGAGVDSNIVMGNYIGTNSTGAAVIENGRGIFFDYGPMHNIIGGVTRAERNIISGNSETGIFIGHDARENKVWGNYIGTNADGTASLGNDKGVLIRYGAKANHIGGQGVGKGNLISGNLNSGIQIYQSGSDSNHVQGNFIGTDSSGTMAVANRVGISVSSGAQYNIIGGDVSEERNIISGNTEEGIWLGGSQTMYNSIQGNFIGVDTSGSQELGNGYYGIYCNGDVKNNSIGGLSAGECNVISANGAGIVFYGSGVDSNTVEGNYIGTNSEGSGDIGNTNYGIWITMGAKDNTIGPANTIWCNGKYGVTVTTDSSTGNTITQNSITNNAELGISNRHGGNGEIAPPVILTVTSTSIIGKAQPSSVVEIYSDPEDEGEIFEGTASVDSDSNFQWSGILSGPYVTATVTDIHGNTSEFSIPVVTSIIEGERSTIPGEFTLYPNFPNPFNPSTKILFSICKTCFVTLKIYDLLGKELDTLICEQRQPGIYTVEWIAKDLTSGIYLYRLEAGDYVKTRKMIYQR